MRDIYAFNPYVNIAKYDANKVETQDMFDEVMMQIDNILFCEEGELIGLPLFGINLRKYLFDTSFPITELQNKLNTLLREYANPMRLANITVSSSIRLMSGKDSNYAVIDIYMDNTKVNTYIL